MQIKVVLTKILPNEHAKAMLKAMRASAIAVTCPTRDTAIGKIDGIEVFRALRTPNGSWVIRHANGLFMEDGVNRQDVEKIRALLKERGGVNEVFGAVIEGYVTPVSSPKAPAMLV